MLGDGTHLITASDTGNQISQVVQIDTTAPTIMTSISAPQSGNGWTGSGTALTVGASDTGLGGGLAHVPGRRRVAGIAVTGPITVPPGQTTYTLTATDFVGNTSTTTVTTDVDATAPSVTCTGPDANWHATDQSVTCTGTDTQSGIAGGTSTHGHRHPVHLRGGRDHELQRVHGGRADLRQRGELHSRSRPISGFKIDKAPPAISCPSGRCQLALGHGLVHLHGQ